MFACSDNNWEGTCDHITFTNKKCTKVPSNLNNEISSIGPGSGWKCLLYEYVFLYLPLYMLCI